jgi:1,4-alpha-glucan branching enzyme
MKVISYERGGLVFLFNFHPTHSHQDVHVPVRVPGKYKAVLDSDQIRFGGAERNTPVEFFSKPYDICGVQNAIQVRGEERSLFLSVIILYLATYFSISNPLFAHT